MSRLRTALLPIVAVLAAWICASSTRADALERALAARDWTNADSLIAARIGEGDRSPELRYNHACVLAQLGRLAEAEKRLKEAVECGFRDFDHMEADEDLEPIRASRTYEAIMEARERLERRAAPAAPRGRTRPDPLEVWRKEHGDTYRYEDEARDGLVFATFLEPSAHERMKATLAELEAHLVKAYFAKAPDDRVLVAIVRPEHASRYFDRPEVRGVYFHKDRRLIARDTGQSLQHEFVHLMHFAHMERTGQRHPIWIQEGLASLYEDYTIRDDGTVEFHPNIRFNIARRQVMSKTAKPWRELAGLSDTAFMSDAERMYPQVRSIFEFMASQRKLEAFYKALGETSRDDPDGTSAIERAFGLPLAKVEDRWKKWMEERGAVDDRVSQGDGSLGITAEEAGDGAKVRSFALRSAARAAGVRVGDVIVEVGGLPVRNRDELQLAVARHKAGDRVTVRFRRDGVEQAVEVELRPLGG
ncbi:MAG: PDZ domain-containing protein [Planctomycetaceae bacterium]|nr:PDZ domain-containing protein [Planctomycetaceae bacterium]